MFYVLQNESTAALRRVPILLTDAATGTTAQTGIASTNIFPYVNINGGSFAGGAGTIGEAGFGQYYYEMDSSEISTLGLAGIHITAVGCRDYDAIAQIAAFNVYSAGGVGISAADVWNYVLPVNSLSAELTLNNADYQTQTAQLSNSVWNTDISTYLSPSAGYDLTQAASGGAGITAGDVWDYVGGRTITGGIADTVTNPILVDPASMTGIAGTVWSTDVSAYTSPSAGYDLTQAASGGAGLTAGDVWSYASRTLTSGGSGISAADVWNYTLSSTSATADATLGNIDSNVTTIQGNTSNIAGTVWNAAVTSYTTNGTFGKNVLRADAANKVGDVTLYSSGGVNGVDADVHRIQNDTAAATVLKEILTGIGGSITANITGNITGSLSGSVGSVSGNVGGNVTGSVGSVSGNVGGNVVGSVASVTAPVSVATASMTGIAGTVWSVASRTITGGTITTVSDKTGYSLSGTQSFNLTGNITGNLSGSVGSVTSAVVISPATQSSIANSVWSANVSGYASPSAGFDLSVAGSGGVSPQQVWEYANRTITGGIADTVTSVTNPVLVNTSSMTGIAGTVWSYGTRTLTSGGGITAGDVWTYDISGITATGTAGKQLNDASASGSVVTIVNGPYKLTSIAEGVDGRIDILQGSVQTINLNLVNGFGQPFNVTGYTLSVDIYDVASSLVESYTPTVNYAGGGNISFDIDGTVTDVIGTYSCVVSLTDGDVIQVGPITILVRPL